MSRALDVSSLLTELQAGRITIEDASARITAALREQPFQDLGFAKVDHHRSVRQGFPEVVLGLGKTPDQIAKIAAQIVGHGHPLLVTRADEAAWNTVKTVVANAQYHEEARCITVKGDCAPGKGTIALCTAGTSDQPVPRRRSAARLPSPQRQ